MGQCGRGGPQTNAEGRPNPLMVVTSRSGPRPFSFFFRSDETVRRQREGHAVRRDVKP